MTETDSVSDSDRQQQRQTEKVLAAVKRRDGTVGSLRLHHFSLRDAVKETYDAWSAGGYAELFVRWVNAARRCHGHAQVVGARAVRVELQAREGLLACKDNA